MGERLSIDFGYKKLQSRTPNLGHPALAGPDPDLEIREGGRSSRPLDKGWSPVSPISWSVAQESRSFCLYHKKNKLLHTQTVVTMPLHLTVLHEQAQQLERYIPVRCTIPIEIIA